MVIVVMGPSGSGKTTIGKRLATALGWDFVDADDLHSADSVHKMRHSLGLTDADREPWLAAVRDRMHVALDSGQPLVVACSALKRAYRSVLRGGRDNVRFVYLHAAPEVLHARLLQRSRHFASASLLPSQLAALEEPGPEALTIDASAPPDAIVDDIRRSLAV